METIFDGKVYNYVIVYIDTIVFAFDSLEEAMQCKKKLMQNDFYIQKDKINIYSKIAY
jgi:hypothetical protein